MADDSGLKGGLSASQPILMLIAGFTAIAWYNVIELNIMVYFRFKRHRGLYFWSLCISSWGIALHALGILVKFFQVWKNDFVSVACICLGWYCMVTGQSLVLYSRLHLVVRKRGGVRWVLVMIVVNAVVLHSITTVLVFGVRYIVLILFLVILLVIEADSLISDRPTLPIRINLSIPILLWRRFKSRFLPSKVNTAHISNLFLPLKSLFFKHQRLCSLSQDTRSRRDNLLTSLFR